MSQYPSIEPSNIYCLQCGYDLTGVAIGGTCPECGARVAPVLQNDFAPASGKAIASMVLGIVAIPSCVLYGVPTLICSILAIIFWYLAKQDIRTGRFSASSASMATAGLACGLVGLGLVLLFVTLASAVWFFA